MLYSCYMPNQNDSIPAWMMEICDHLNKRPDKAKYQLLLDGLFGINGLEKDSANEGIGFRLGFLFSDRPVSPNQICLYLSRYGIIKDTARQHSLDLIGLETPKRAVPYREAIPLESLAIGYFRRRPNLNDIDKIFTAYDTIEAKIKEL